MNEASTIAKLLRLTLDAVDGVQRTHNFWVNHIARLEVASDAAMLSDQCEAYDALDVTLDALKDVVKKAEALKAALGNKILVEGFRVVGVPTQYVGQTEFSLAQRVTGSFTDKEQGFNWLREIGEDALITETVNSHTLSAFLKRWVEDTAKSPPPFVKVNTMDYVKIKRPTKKKGE